MDKRPNISISNSGGVPLARARSINRDEIERFYKLVKTAPEECVLISTPISWFNIDEKGIQTNNKLDKVIAKKGSTCVDVVRAKERGIKISVCKCGRLFSTTSVN